MGFKPFSPDDGVDLGESAVSSVTGLSGAVVDEIGGPAAEMPVQLVSWIAKGVTDACI